MTDRIWHKGPPPHVGWWNASRGRDESIWRWWDRAGWSKASPHSRSADVAGRQAKYLAPISQDSIEWTHYWPENAHVPRLDPTDGHWTFNTGERPNVEGPVEVKFRGGDSRSSRSVKGWHWGIGNHAYDIVAWRPAK